MTEQEKDEPKTYTVCETYKQGHNWVIECRGLMLDGAEICRRVYVNEWVSKSAVDVEAERLLNEIEAIVLAANCVHEGDVQGLFRVACGEYWPITYDLASMMRELMPDLQQRMKNGSLSPELLRNQVRKDLLDLQGQRCEADFAYFMTPEERRFHDSGRECHYKP